MPLTTYKSFADALSAPRTTTPRPAPAAANDNKPRKAPQPRYRGTLPALRWLYDNHPDLAEPMARAVRSLSATTWDADAADNDQKIRPTVGELVKAATDPKTGEWLQPTIETDKDGNTSVRLGALKFVRGELVECGETKKGRKLSPRDRVVSRDEAPADARNPYLYVFGTKATTQSPLHAEPYSRALSGEPALAPMYAPLSGVEEGRAELVALGVDGSVPFDKLPFPATKGMSAIASGADFLGGIVGSSGTASSGAVNMGDLPDAPRGEARLVVEAVASGATLKDIGERMGLDGARVDRAAKDALVIAARALVASNDNSPRKKKVA
jgi:hypothetical protein